MIYNYYQSLHIAKKTYQRILLEDHQFLLIEKVKLRI